MNPRKTCPASLLRPLLLLIGAGADKDGMNGPEQARTHAKHASPLRTEICAFSFLPFLILPISNRFFPFPLLFIIPYSPLSLILALVEASQAPNFDRS